MTNSGEADAATPVVSPPSQSPRAEAMPRSSDLPATPAASTASAFEQSVTATSGLVFGTPQGDAPIVKDAPTSAGPDAGYTPNPSSFDGDGDGFLSVPEFINALQARYPTYEWPTGFRLDLAAVVAGLEAQSQKMDMQFENRYEGTLLGIAFVCAWQYTLLDATYANDSALVAESVERLRTEIESNPSLVGIRQYEEDVIWKAELGDPGPLQQAINGGGCADQPWESGTPESSSVQSSDPRAIRAPVAYRQESDLA